jgi:hypothetical protein
MKKDKGLYLTDGTFFSAKSGFGRCEGQVVMVHANNFVEIPTDISAKGLILVFSFPEAGFSPLKLKEMENYTCKASGVVVQKIANTRNGQRLKEFYKSRGISLLEGVDTRAVALHIQDDYVFGEIFTNEELILSDEKILLRRLPNHGPRLAILGGGTPESLLRDLVELGYDLSIYEAEIPSRFFQTEAIVLTDNQLISSKENLVKLKELDLPIIAIAEASYELAKELGGVIEESVLFSENHSFLDKETQEILTAKIRATKRLKKVPGEVIYEELSTNRPAGYLSNNIIGIEFFPEKNVLTKILRRAGL